MVWNRVDESRRAEVGAGRAASEWLMRLGGAVMLRRSHWIEQYNALPAGRLTPLGLDARGSKVTDQGLEHIRPLNALIELRLDGCSLIGDSGIDSIVGSHSRDTLQYLDLSDTRVTQDGVAKLAALKELRFLRLDNIFDLEKEMLVDGGGGSSSSSSSSAHRGDDASDSVGYGGGGSPTSGTTTMTIPTGILSLQESLPDCQIHWASPPVGHD